MKATSLLLAVLLLTGCAHSDPWSTRDTVMQLGVTVILAADARTTTHIQYVDGIYEAQPLTQRVLGRQPSTSDTYQYFATLAITNYMISRALPAKWRPYWQGASVVPSVIGLNSNCKRELCK
jgi:hypothetical protein